MTKPGWNKRNVKTNLTDNLRDLTDMQDSAHNLVGEESPKARGQLLRDILRGIARVIRREQNTLAVVNGDEEFWDE